MKTPIGLRSSYDYTYLWVKFAQTGQDRKNVVQVSIG